jgi:hypothetical protein
MSESLPASSDGLSRRSIGQQLPFAAQTPPDRTQFRRIGIAAERRNTQ